MGLFGLFGPKKSAAQKAYEDALEKFPTENVGIPEMEAAINAWEAAEGPQTATWEADLCIALCYDCGHTTKLDEAAGGKYHDRARAKIAKSGDGDLQEWADWFYYWYNMSAINFKRPLSREAVNLRRLGDATMHAASAYRSGRMTVFTEYMLRCADVPEEEEEMVRGFVPYLKELLASISRFGDKMDDHNSNPNRYEEADLAEVRKYMARQNEEATQWNSLLGRTKDMSPEDHRAEIARSLTSDLHGYVYAYQFYHASPLAFAHVFSNVDDSLDYGVGLMMGAFLNGNAMALHELTVMAFGAEEVYAAVERRVPEGNVKKYLFPYLLESARAGDYTAKELMDQYFK